MADCPSCGSLVKAGDWTCGRCGAPVAGAAISPAGGGAADSAPDPYGSAPGFAPQPATAGAPERAGFSGTLRIALVIAVVAIVAVWFFVVRGPSTSGDEFLGTWTGSSTAGIATVAVARPADDFRVTISGGQAGQQVAVPAHVDGDELVITLDDFATIAGEANADRFRDVLKALAGDFRLIFRSVDATHLELRIEGTNNENQSANTTVTLVKSTP